MQISTFTEYRHGLLVNCPVYPGNDNMRLLRNPTIVTGRSKAGGQFGHGCHPHWN